MSEIVKRPWGRFVLPSLLLLLALCLVLIPFGSDEADAAITDDDGNTYQWVQDTYLPREVILTSYNGGVRDTYTVPDTVEDAHWEYNVVGIGDWSFGGTYVTEVTLGKYVRTIAGSAFSDAGIEVLNVHGSLESIGVDAFANSSLEEIRILSYVDSIELGDNVFYACSGFRFVSGTTDLRLNGVYSDPDFQNVAVFKPGGDSARTIYFDFDYRYNVEHYLMNEDGNGYTLSSDSMDVLYGQDTTAAVSKTFENYYVLPFEQKSINKPYMWNGEYRFNATVIKIYYDLDVKSIAVPVDFKQTYDAGDAFVPFDVQLTYYNDAAVTLTVTEDMVTGFSTLGSGEFTGGIEFRGVTTQFTYIVNEVTYDLWVGGTQITSDDNEVSDGNGGTATFDIMTFTLTLNDFDIGTSGIGIQSTMSETLTIVVVGENNIVSTLSGIEVSKLVINGSGTLNIESGAIGIDVTGQSGVNFSGVSDSEMLGINITSADHGIYRIFDVADGSKRSSSTVFRYCDIKLIGDVGYTYGIHGGYGVCFYDSDLSIMGYSTGIYSAGGTLGLTVENSSVYIDAHYGIRGWAADPKIINSTVEIVAEFGIHYNISDVGDISLYDSDLRITYGDQGANSSLTIDVYGDSSIRMWYDPGSDGYEYQDYLMNSSFTINVNDPQDGVFEYVVLTGKSSDSMEQYTRDTFVNKVKEFEEDATETYLDMPYSLTWKDYMRFFEFHPMLTVSFDGDGREGSMGPLYTYEGGTVTAPVESQFIPSGEEVFVGWKDSEGQVYLPGRAFSVTSDTVLKPIYGELVPVSISVNGTPEFMIGDVLSDSDLTVTIVYNNGASTIVPITDAIFTVTGFDTGAYVPDDAPSTATVTYDGLSCTFEYPVDKLPQSTHYEFGWRLSLSSSPDTSFELLEYFDYEGSNRFFFGSGKGDLSIEILDMGGAVFDFDEEEYIVSNVTKPGTFTVKVTRAGDDTYQEATAVYDIPLGKVYLSYLDKFILLSPNDPKIGDSVNVGLYNFTDGEITVEILDGGTATASINDRILSITDRGTDGTVVIKVSVSGSSFYSDSSGTYTVTFDKIPGNQEAGYTEPTGLKTHAGSSTDNIALPERWSWSERVEFTSIGNKEAVAVYTPADPETYEVHTVTLVVNVGRIVVEPPFIESKARTGETLIANVPSSDLYSVKTNNGGVDVGTYDVVLTLNDTATYEWDSVSGATVNGADITLQFRIVTAINEWTTVPSINGWNYGATPDSPEYVAIYGVGTATVEYRLKSGIDSDYTTTVPVNAGGYLMRVTIAGTDEYSGLVHVSEFTISKVAPQYDVPSVTAHYGQTLADARLPVVNVGTWVWVDPLSTSVGDVGGKTFRATLTPKDSVNHLPVENVNVTVTVSPAPGNLAPDFVPLDALTAHIGGSTEDLVLEDGWAFVSVTTFDEVGSEFVEVTFTSTDSINYGVYGTYITVSVSGHTWSDHWGYTVAEGHAHVCTVDGCEEHGPITGHGFDDVCDVTCDDCGYDREVPHVFTGEWIKDATHHWHVCETDECEAIDTKAEHVYDHACDVDCNTCGQTRTVTHDFTGEWIEDATYHWNICETDGCDEIGVKLEHGHDHACDTECNTCGYIRAIAHDFTGEWTKDATHHWHVCETEGCEVTDTKAEHSHDDVCDVDCNTCGQTRTVPHDFTGEWIKDATHHWHICETEGCEVTDTKVGHSYDNACDSDCNACGYTRVITHDFTGEWTRDATHHWHVCETEGCEITDSKIEHSYDGVCDVDCNTCGYIRTVTHDFTGEWIKDATHHWHICATNGCEVIDTKVGHSYDNACDSDCNACGYTRVITHDFTGGWIKDSTHHWHICATNGCEVTDTKVGHDFVDGCDEDCGVCGHERVAPQTTSDEWSHGDHHHWKDCTACTGQVGLAEHQYEGDSTLCNICDHDWSIHHNYTVLHKDASGHWYECSHALCVEASSLEVHVAGTPDPLTGQVLCVDCGYEMQAASQTPDQTPEGPSDEDDGGISIGIVAGGVAGVLALAGVGAFLFLRGRP